MVILLLSATAGRSQEAAASSELIPNVGITPAAALLVHLFTAAAQVSGAALPTPSSQAESPVLHSGAELGKICFRKVYLRLCVHMWF